MLSYPAADMMDMLQEQPSFSNPEHDTHEIEPTTIELNFQELDDLELELNPLYEAARESEVPRQDVEENFKWEVDHLYTFLKRLYSGEHEELR